MKIVVCGNYGAQNLGDELILEGILVTLKSIAPGAEITILSGNPKQTRATHSVNSVAKFPSGFRSLRRSLIASLRASKMSEAKTTPKQAVRECDYFILGGGGLFNDLDWHASIIWYMQGRQALKYGKPLIIYGQSIGPLSDVGKFLVKRIFSKAAFIGVRDEDSAVELKNLGINKAITVTPDLAFRLPAACSDRSIGVRHGLPTLATTPTSPVTDPLDSSTIIISLRNLPSLNENFIHEFSAFCNWLISEQKCNLKFIDFQQGPHCDTNLHEKIIARISQKEKVIHLDKISDTGELLAHFQQADFVFAMRLHAIISAIKTSRPFLAISYSRKINAMIKDSGLEKYLIAHDHIYLDQLKNFFLFLREKKTEIHGELTKINSTNLEKLEKDELLLKDQLK